MKAAGFFGTGRAPHPTRETKPAVATSFTLIEVLVAAALTAVLAAVALAAVSGVLSHWNRTAGRLATAAEARLVLEQLAQDLQGAIFRSDGNIWLVVTIAADSLALATEQAHGRALVALNASLGKEIGLMKSARPSVVGQGMRLVAAVAAGYGLRAVTK